MSIFVLCLYSFLFFLACIFNRFLVYSYHEFYIQEYVYTYVHTYDFFKVDNLLNSNTF